MKITDKIEDAAFKQKLRKAATKLIDSMQRGKTHVILLSGMSSQPAYSLVAEAWRRRYPGKPLPRAMPITIAREPDIRGKNVAIFEELTVEGKNLAKAGQSIARFKPAKVKKMALLQRPDRKKPAGVEIGAKTAARVAITTSRTATKIITSLLATCNNQIVVNR